MEVNNLIEQSSREIQELLRKVYQQGYEDGIKSTQQESTLPGTIEYVDMGLPSGTKWAFLPQKMTYNDAISKYQLPTEDQLSELFTNSEWRTGYYEDKDVIVLKSKINKKEIFYFTDQNRNHDFIWFVDSFMSSNEAMVYELWNINWRSCKTQDRSIPATTAVISR